MIMIIIIFKKYNYYTKIFMEIIRFHWVFSFLLYSRYLTFPSFSSRSTFCSLI